MATTHPVPSPATFYAPSFKSDVPGTLEDLATSDEVSLPLLKPDSAYVYQPTISGPRRSALSSFVDDNAGLLLVAASQFFFSAMNVLVKLLTSLDEPVPMLEVRRTLNGHSYPS